MKELIIHLPFWGHQLQLILQNAEQTYNFCIYNQEKGNICDLLHRKLYDDQLHTSKYMSAK